MKIEYNRLLLCATTALVGAPLSPVIAQSRQSDAPGLANNPSADKGGVSADAPAAPVPARASSGNARAGGAEGGLTDIVVTARRVEERLQDVLISITIFNRQQLSTGLDAMSVNS